MLTFLPPPIVGTLAYLLLILNTLSWGLPLYGLALLKLLAPTPAWRQWTVRLVIRIATYWVSINHGIYRLTQKTVWDVSGLEGLNPNHSYLLICNHQSWLDILVLLHVFNRRIPFPRFFVKQELMWMPVVGVTCWALDFPFMKRYSREVLKKRPELRGRDLETTRKACERFKETSVTVLNFLEGTRLTPKKHARQESPYQHLLRPKAGGIAFTLAAMGEQFNSLLDVTIIYPDKPANMWHFISGGMSRVVVHVQQRDIPPEFLNGDYLNDPHFRQQIQGWVGELWAGKDALIEQMQRQKL